ncbi:MAG: lipopolysaccharide transport system ATP-binding protein [Arenicella sp.]|jgi:lipopolysaccharide transport system ATP-binding protein
MSRSVISVENIGKMYRLGEVSTGTITHDLHRAWAKLRGKPDPFATVGISNDRETAGGDYVWALKDINLEIKEGEILGIIGRNGAGKSTLLKLLSRVTAPTTGRIRTRGRIASLLEVGTGFHPELTGRENIYLNGAILGMAKREITARLEEIVEFSGCAKYIDTPVKRYSSGMQVRLGFAVAAHLECEILIVDEVLAVGDIEFQQKCMGWMQDMSQAQKKTILFVSHNLDAIHRVCNTGANIANGILDFRGDIDSTIKHYLTNKELGDSDIFDTRERWGDGQIRISDFKILNVNGELQTSLASGGNYVCELHYQVENTGLLPVKDIVASIDFIDNRGSTTLLLNSSTVNTSLVINHANGVIRCEVLDLNLAPGDYSMTLYLGQSNRQTYDCLNNVINVSVSGGDFFGTGHPGYPEQCRILKRTVWQSE